MSTIELQVEGMSCGGCESAVRNAVERLDAVGSARADHTSGKVTIEASEGVDLDAVRRAISDAGYAVAG